jgi:flagellar biosynthesis component FlhA
LARKISNSWKNAMEKAYDTVVLLCDVRLRQPIADIVRRAVPRLPVAAYDEIIAGVAIESIESIKIDIESTVTNG